MAKGPNQTERLLGLYETMLLIRRSEETLSTLFANGEIPGFIHLSIGQEAVAAGVMAALETRDTIASNHRGHGHSIAKGIPLERFFLELLAKREGLCGGRGGSMHVADLSVGMLGANGIVAAGVPIALGSALAHQVRGTGGIAAVFFGDGALAEGVVHESLNLAALWRAPLLFVLENNGWAEFSPGTSQFAGDVHALAAAFGIASRRVEQDDPVAIADAAEALVAEIRAGGGPRLLECVTTRVQGHFEGDPQKYRSEGELDRLAAKDPLARCRARLARSKAAAARLESLEAEVERRIEHALEAARAGGEPDLESARADVYTPAGG